MDKKEVVNFVCGGIAGCTSRTAVAPLERLKILYQVQDVVQTRIGTTTITAKHPKYSSVWSSLHRIGMEEGIRGYFRGNGANCARVFPYTAIQFAVFERMKPLLIAPDEKTIGPAKKLVGGAFAGIVSVFITYPLDFVRARLTIQGGLATTQYSGIWDAIQGTYRTGGITTFYRGMTPTVVGVAPYVGLNFMVFESLKSRVPQNSHGQPETIYLVGCGAIAGACGQTAAYPMDLLRRRLQLSDLRVNVPTYSKFSTGMWQGLKAIVRDEGIVGMYKGIVPNTIKVVPSIAIMFTTNELLQRMLNTSIE